MSLLFSPLLFATCFSSFREEKSNERIEMKVNKWIKRKKNCWVCRRRILSFGKVDRSTDITKHVSSNDPSLTIFSIVSSSNRGSIRQGKIEKGRLPRGEAASSFKRMEVRLIVRFTKGWKRDWWCKTWWGGNSELKTRNETRKASGERLSTIAYCFWLPAFIVALFNSVHCFEKHLFRSARANPPW